MYLYTHSIVSSLASSIHSISNGQIFLILSCGLYDLRDYNGLQNALTIT